MADLARCLAGADDFIQLGVQKCLAAGQVDDIDVLDTSEQGANILKQILDGYVPVALAVRNACHTFVAPQRASCGNYDGYAGQFGAAIPNIAPVMSRLREFTLKPALSAMLGQSTPKVDLNEVFTNNKVFVTSLNKGKIGSETAKLLGSLIVSQLWSLTLARADTPEDHRSPVNIYIDEVQDYLNLPLDLSEALSQARSYQVGFTLAHQYRRQLPTSLMSAIDGNVQNIITFGLYDARDCIEMSKLFNDELLPEDIHYQAQHHVYLRTLHHGQPVVVSGQTLAPSRRLQNPDKVKELSAINYGTMREVIYKQNLQDFYRTDNDLDEIFKAEVITKLEDQDEETVEC